MARDVHASTLFHLVPTNRAAHDALLHPDNSRFVSPSLKEDELGQYRPGLEIGFHVPSIPSGRVITRLGRAADLVLRERPVSAVHVAFEIHPETLVVLLSVRSKHSSSVKVACIKDKSEQEEIDGDCVIVYGQDYRITIVSYEFELTWQKIGVIGAVESLRDLAIQGYRNSVQRLQDVRSRDLPTEFDEPDLHTWHNTRLHTARKYLFREAEGEPRVLIGRGQFGDVFRAVDLASGNPIAVKVVKLDHYPNTEQARAVLHREIKALERLKHRNIVECLGIAKWDTLEPEIFMPLRPGNLRSLANAKNRLCSGDSLCMQVLEQMLGALDYLAHQRLCHRDVKPENILYWHLRQGLYSFQLADFGLVNHQRFAVTFCGTGYYQAPELYSDGRYPQSPKMDVWSLFATLIDVHPQAVFPPKTAESYHDILLAIRTAATLLPDLRSMVREDPTHRASAAQLLVAHFGGHGLTTPRAAVPPIGPPPEEAGLDGNRPSEDAPTSIPVPPLIVYPAHRRRQQTGPGNGILPKPLARPRRPPLPLPLQPIRDGIVKSRAPSVKRAKQKLAEKQIDDGSSNEQPNKELKRGQADIELCIPGGFPE